MSCYKKAKKAAQDSALAAEQRCEEMRQQLAELSFRHLEDSATPGGGGGGLGGVATSGIVGSSSSSETLYSVTEKKVYCLEQELEAARAEAARLAEERSALEAEFGMLRIRLLDAQLDAEAAAKDKMERTIAPLRIQITEKNFLLEALRLDTDKTTTCFNQLVKEAGDLRAALYYLQVEVAAKTEALNRIEAVEADSRRALEAKTAELSMVRSQLEARITELSEANRRLRDQVEQAKAELAQSVEELEETRRASSQAADDLRERCTAALAKFERRMEEARVEAEAGLDEKRQLAEGLRTSRDQALADLADLRAAFDSSVQASERRHRDLHEQLEAQQAITSECRQCLEDKLACAHHELDLPRQRLVELEKAVVEASAAAEAARKAQMEGRIAEGFERRLKELQEELRVTHDHLMEKDRRLAEREAQLEEMQDERARLGTELERAKQSIEQAQDSVTAERDRLQRRADSLQHRLADIESELLAKEAELDRVSNRLALSACQQEELLREAARLRRELLATGERVQGASEEAARLREARAKAEATVAELQDQLQELEYKNSRLRSGTELRASAAREEAAGAARAASDRMAERLEVTETAMKVANDEISQLRASLLERDHQVATLADTCERCKAALKKAIEERDEEAEMKERLRVRCQQLEESVAAATTAKQHQRRHRVVDGSESPMQVSESPPQLLYSTAESLAASSAAANAALLRLRRASSDRDLLASPIFGRRPFVKSSAAVERNSDSGGGGGSGLPYCEDEELHLLEWKRIAELQQRNDRQPQAHVCSSYPVETQAAGPDIPFVSGIKIKSSNTTAIAPAAASIAAASKKPVGYSLVLKPGRPEPRRPMFQNSTAAGHGGSIQKAGMSFF